MELVLLVLLSILIHLGQFTPTKNLDRFPARLAQSVVRLLANTTFMFLIPKNLTSALNCTELEFQPTGCERC